MQYLDSEFTTRGKKRKQIYIKTGTKLSQLAKRVAISDFNKYNKTNSPEVIKPYKEPLYTSRGHDLYVLIERQKLNDAGIIIKYENKKIIELHVK